MITTIDKQDLRRQKRFGKRSSIRETVAKSNSYNSSEDNRQLLLACQNDWDRLARFRAERARCLRFKNGDQWGDIVTDPDTGKPIREDVMLSNSGKVPLKHNFIQQFIRNIHGQLLGNRTQPVVFARAKDDAQLSEMLTNTLHAVRQLNEIDVLDISVMEDLLLGGLACVKTRYCFWSTKNRTDGRYDLVNPNRLFFNTDIEDPRLMDLRRVGEIHDYTFDELAANFADNIDDQNALRDIYTPLLGDTMSGRDVTGQKKVNAFLIPDSVEKCRVIEVWQLVGRWVTYCHDYADGTQQITLKSEAEIEKINRDRVAQGVSLGLQEDEIALIYHKRQWEQFWSVKYLTPNGVCIKEFETPYKHEEHPYTIATLPMIDGIIRGVMSDIIDIQRYINRLIVMIDFIMGSSAKGVLMVPEESIPEGMSLDDFASEWVKANGVIMYRSKNGTTSVPTQVASNSTNIGAYEMLNIQLSLIQQISGLSGAVQGQTPRSNTPSSLYAQEAQNSSNNYRVVFEMFSGFLRRRDEKMLKILMQYYTDRRYIDISGRSYKETAKYYDPLMASKIIDFNLTVSQSTDTPVFRQAADDLLFDFLKGNMIDFEMFLDNCSLPFADKLKADIKARKETAGGQLTPEAMQQIMAQQQSVGENPQARELTQQFAS